MNVANMFAVPPQPNSHRSSMPPRKLAKSVSDLSDREEEIVAQIKSKLSSLGAHIVFDLGRESDCSEFSLSLTGFRGVGYGFDGTFYLSRHMLSEMAADMNKFIAAMSRIEKMVAAQETLQRGFESWSRENEKTDAQRAAERRSHQMKLDMMNAFDFWNENESVKSPITPNTNNEDEKSLAELFAQAIEEYKDRTLRGNVGMSEEEIQERLAQFREKHFPENGTEEEIALFYEALATLESFLRQEARHEDMLITPASGGEEANGDLETAFLKSRLMVNTPLQQRLHN